MVICYIETMKRLLTALLIVCTVASVSSAEFDQGFDALCDYFEKLPIDTDVQVIVEELELTGPDKISPRTTLDNSTEYTWYNVNDMLLTIGLIPPGKLLRNVNRLLSVGPRKHQNNSGDEKNRLLFNGHYAVITDNTKCIYWQYTNETPIIFRGESDTERLPE